MGKYDINFRKLIKHLLPISLRTNIVEFIYVLIQPIGNYYFRFLTVKQENEDKLSYNCQYPNLQRLLNDKLDVLLRRIKVQDSGEIIEDFLIYSNAELKPIVLGKVVLYSSSLWVYKPFIVLLPCQLMTEKNKVIRLLDTYKFLGTKYNIVQI